MSLTAAKGRTRGFTTSPALSDHGQAHCALSIGMAKLAQLPHQAIIDGFKGKVDFYVWNGIPCARAWPRKLGRNRSPAVRAQWSPWAYAAREWKNLSETVQNAFRELAINSGLSGRDMQVRAYMTGLYRYPTP